MYDERKWISVAEAAERMELSRRAVAGWVRSGRLTSRVRADGQREVPLDAVEEFQHSLFSDAPDFPQTFRGHDAFEHDSVRVLAYPTGRATPKAGAELYEARHLANTYRDELRSARRAHRVELGRARRSARVAWFLTAAAATLLAGGAWWFSRQQGDQRISQAQLSHLTERLGLTAAENQRLQAAMDARQSESAEVAAQLEAAKLRQAESAGQLAAGLVREEKQKQELRSLTAKWERQQREHRQALQQAVRSALEAERARLARIRYEKSQQAERQRRELSAKARAAASPDMLARAGNRNPPLQAAGENRSERLDELEHALVGSSR